MKPLRPLLIALQFLTLLPIDFRDPLGDEESGRSLLFYPLVGLLIGMALAVCGEWFHGLSDRLISALLLTLWVVLTGGLHLDGLADSADAWLGGYGDRERTLAIMHDPCSGPLGVVSLMLLLLLKFAALESLVAHHAAALLIVVPLLGRTALLALFLTTPYVRVDGLGARLAQHMPRGASLAVVMLVGMVVVLWLGRVGICLVFGSTLLLFLLRLLMQRRIGGTTGDTAGALLEMTEAFTLLIGAVSLSMVS